MKHIKVLICVQRLQRRQILQDDTSFGFRQYSTKEKRITIVVVDLLENNYNKHEALIISEIMAYWVDVHKYPKCPSSTKQRRDSHTWLPDLPEVRDLKFGVFQ